MMLSTSRTPFFAELIIPSIVPGNLLRHLVLLAFLASTALLFASVSGVAAPRLNPGYQQQSCYLLDIDGCTKIIESRHVSAKTRAFAYMTRAKSHYLRRTRQEAIADYSEALRFNPKLAAAYCGRGSARERDDSRRAMADLSRGLRLEPNNTECLKGRARLSQRLGDHRSAIADYTRALRINPHQSGMLEERADVYMAMHDYNHAIVDFTTLLRQPQQSDDELLYLERASAWAHKGFALHQTNDASVEARRAYHRAIADYTEVIKLRPRHVPFIELRAELWLFAGNPDEAIADWNEVLRLKPNRKSAFTSRAEAWATKGDLDRAIEDLTEALRDDPDELTKKASDTSSQDSALSSAYLSRAELFVAKGDYEKALADFDKILQLWPDQEWARWKRAPSEYLLGKLDAAVADLTRGAEVNPSSAEIALWLEIVNQRLQRPSRLAETSESIDMTKWPAPIVRLYLGKTTLKSVLAAIDRPSLPAKRQLCDAQFFGAELASLKGSNSEAEHLFRLAAAQCADDSLQRSAANAELNRSSAADQK